MKSFESIMREFATYDTRDGDAYCIFCGQRTVPLNPSEDTIVKHEADCLVMRARKELEKFEYYKPARVDIYLGETLYGSQIAIDGITLPYKNFVLSYSSDGYPRFKLTRVIGDDGLVTDDLFENPIIEYVEAHPLVSHASFSDIAGWRPNAN
jgi:hypothetical protein